MVGDVTQGGAGEGVSTALPEAPSEHASPREGRVGEEARRSVPPLVSHHHEAARAEVAVAGEGGAASASPISQRRRSSSQERRNIVCAASVSCHIAACALASTLRYRPLRYRRRMAALANGQASDMRPRRPTPRWVGAAVQAASVPPRFVRPKPPSSGPPAVYSPLGSAATYLPSCTPTTASRLCIAHFQLP